VKHRIDPGIEFVEVTFDVLYEVRANGCTVHRGAADRPCGDAIAYFLVAGQTWCRPAVEAEAGRASRIGTVYPIRFVPNRITVG